MSIHIAAAEVQTNEGGNTIWVHSPTGSTILRIKCTGKIVINPGCVNDVAHADMIVQGDINLCIPKEA